VTIEGAHGDWLAVRVTRGDHLLGVVTSDWIDAAPGHGWRCVAVETSVGTIGAWAYRERGRGRGRLDHEGARNGRLASSWWNALLHRLQQVERLAPRHSSGTAIAF
jgi:hypothetical protein